MASHVQESPVYCCRLAGTEGEGKNLRYEAQRKQADQSRPVNPLVEERSPLHLADSIFVGLGWCAQKRSPGGVCPTNVEAGFGRVEVIDQNRPFLAAAPSTRAAPPPESERRSGGASPAVQRRCSAARENSQPRHIGGITHSSPLRWRRSGTRPPPRELHELIARVGLQPVL